MTVENFAENIEAFEEEPNTVNPSLKALLTQAEELVDLEYQIKDLEQLLQKLSGRATELKTQIIPDKMAEAGLTEFATPEGNRLKLEDFVSGSLPKEPLKRDVAIKELESWGAESIIKNEVVLTFEKSQHNEAMAIADELLKQGFNCEVKSGVHPQTYLAAIRERNRSGEPVDAEKMGVFLGRRTKVTLKSGSDSR